MLLDLCNVINIPGSRADFEYDLDISDADFISISSFLGPVHVVGYVLNTAGILELYADIDAEALCVCARCCKEFTKHFALSTTAVLADEITDEENSDIFLLHGDFVDVDEIIVTAFILDLDQRILCSPDCKGLCPRCGADLNDGPCSCSSEIDPRLSVLGELLGKE